MTVIVCDECDSIFSCIDKNKTTHCSECERSAYCFARFDFTGKIEKGICKKCIEKLFNKRRS